MDPLWPPAAAVSPSSQPVRAAPGDTGSRPAAWIELVLYPERFYRERLDAFAAFLTTPRVQLVLYLLGLQLTLDHLERAQDWVRSVSAAPDGYVLLVALFIGPPVFGSLAYYLGRFWFRIRLHIVSGYPDPARSAAAFTASSLASVVPSLAFAILSAIFRPGDISMVWFVLPMFGWTFYLDYTAARVAFAASRRGAWTWFVIVPVLGTVLLGILLARTMT